MFENASYTKKKQKTFDLFILTDKVKLLIFRTFAWKNVNWVDWSSVSALNRVKFIYIWFKQTNN